MERRMEEDVGKRRDRMTERILDCRHALRNGECNFAAFQPRPLDTI